jgi:branched-chain amino acid transport system permease protein
MNYLLDGLSLGCIYAFIALGYTMVYGIIKLINFAHGEIFMLGAFAAYLSLTRLGVERVPLPEPAPVVLAWIVALALAALGSASAAVLIERLAYRPLRGRADRIAALLAALGVSLFLQNVVLQLSQAKQIAFPSPRAFTSFASIAPGYAPRDAAYVIGVHHTRGGQGPEGRLYLAAAGEPITAEAIATARALGAAGFYEALPMPADLPKYAIYGALAASAAVLYVLVKHTRHGKAMRAVSYSEETARLMGVNVDLTISFTFFIGAGLAGVGGLLWGLRYGKVDALMGFFPGLKAFIAAVLGGIGSIPGAVAGGITLGVLEALCQGYLPDAVSGYKDAVAFVALIVILLVRPSGFFGRFEGEKV